MDNCSIKNNRKFYITSVLIWLLFFIPPLFFIPGKFHDKWIFVNYREPKLAAFQVLAWSLIAWSSFAYFDQLKILFSKLSIKTKIIFFSLCLLTSYACLSSVWALVPQAVFYEIYQWITLCFLFYVLLVLFLNDSRLKHLAIYSLVLSFAVVSLIGLIQLQVFLPFLTPISKWHPISSTFGGKNTCFVTLVSQLFLVLGLAIYFFRKNIFFLFYSLILLLCIELFYTALSFSRTAYFAVFLSLFLFLILSFITKQINISFKTLCYTIGILLFSSLSIIFWLYIFTSSNLVINPGFEIGNQAGDAPKHWILYPKNETQFGYWAKNTAHTGKRSVTLVGDQKKQIGWKGKIIHLKPPYPKIITFSGWSKAKRVTKNTQSYSLLFKIIYDDQSYIWFSPSFLRFTTGTHVWEHKKTTKIFYQKRVAAIQPYVILEKGSGVAWFDDISIKRHHDSLIYWFRFISIWNYKIKPLLLHPSRFFTQTARGAAIIDTLDMFKDHPIGVGAGNWGFMYSLYHKHMRKKDFSKKFQIRRAHNDFIQYLGELGIFGFVILIFLTCYPLWCLVVLLKNNLCGDYAIYCICLISQFVVLIVSMFFTYYLEYPYRKFLYVFLIVLASTCIELSQHNRH